MNIGDYCTWNNELVSGQKNWIVCEIVGVTHSAPAIVSTYRLRPIERQPNGISDLWVRAGEVRFAPGFCLICRRNVGVEDSLLKVHNKGSELCYGSYMPGL